MISQLLSLSSFPIFIIAKVNDPTMPIIIERLEGCVESQDYLNFLDRNIDLNPEINVQIAHVHPALHQERIIREQQDKELKEAEDIVRERFRNEEIKKNIEKEKADQENNIKMQQEIERKIKIEKIGEEPALGPNSTQITIRLPDGHKIERRFLKDTSVGVLYDFIETQNLNNFEIVTGFPSAILDDKNISLENSGLHPKGLVHIREISLI